MMGITKWFSSKLGYGFLIPIEPGQPTDIDSEIYNDDSEHEEIFVHFSAITTPEDNGFKTLYRGDQVEFEIVDGDKGKEAQEVVIVEKSARRNKYKRSEDGEEITEKSEVSETIDELIDNEGVEDDSAESKGFADMSDEEQYDLYKQETGGTPVRMGKPTKKFTAWKEEKL